MKKHIVAGIVGVTAGLLGSTQVAGPLLAQDTAKNSSVYEQLDLFGDIFERIRAQYVEEVEPSKLIEAAIDVMMHYLDTFLEEEPPTK